MKLAFKTKPFPHQARALRHLLRKRGGGLQVPMRYGKSWVGINYAAACRLKWDLQRVLVITVTSGVGVWENEVAAHCPVPWRVVAWETGEVLASGKGVPQPSYKGLNVDLVRRPLTFTVVNYANLFTRETLKQGGWIAVSNKRLLKFNADIVIADESHHLGDPAAEQSQRACELARRAHSRVIMTGTMFHRKPLMVFGQAKFYDDGATLGSSFKAYKERITVMGGYGGYEILRYQNLKWMVRRMKRWVHMEKYVPPRSPSKNLLGFHLTGKGLANYTEMEKESVLVLDDGEVIMSDIVLARHMRCQMIAGGWVKSETGGYKRVGRDKYDMGLSRLQEYMDNDIRKVVIGCRFRPELYDAGHAAKRVGYKVVFLHGGVPRRERNAIIAKWTHTKEPCVIVCQVNAAKEAINLSASTTTLHWSLSSSFVAHDQFSRRMELYGDKRVLQHDFLVALGTRDEVTYEAIQLGQDVASYIQSHPSRVERITAKDPRT